MKKIDVTRVSSLISTIEYLRRSGGAGFSKVFTVTPEDAMYILENYGWKNRNISDSRVLTLATLMRRGEFLLNGETLKFGRIKEENNRPIRMDGGHRLWAIIEAGIPVQLEVYFYNVYSLADNLSVFETLDLGRIRTTADILHIYEIPQAKVVLSIMRQLIRYYDLKSPFIGYDIQDHNELITNEMCKQFYISHKEGLTRAVSVVSKMKKAKFARPAVVGSLYFHHRYHLNNDRADKFVDDIASGANLKPNSVELTLTKYLRLFKASVYEVSKISRLERNIACNMAFDHIQNNFGKPFRGFTVNRMSKWLDSIGIVPSKLLSKV